MNKNCKNLIRLKNEIWGSTGLHFRIKCVKYLLDEMLNPDSVEPEPRLNFPLIMFTVVWKTMSYKIVSLLN